MANKNFQKTVKYKVFFPGGNTTALVYSGQKNSFASVSKQIMASDAVIEQVGFVLPEGRSFRLEMMGGELCVNAARSAASWWLNEKDEREVKFNISGIDRQITAKKDKATVVLLMPGSLVVSCSAVTDGHLVVLQGISYIIRTKKDIDPATLVRTYYNNAPAFGIITVEKQAENILKITPAVWVKDTATFINESACGSGSVAACVPFLNETAGRKFQVEQPSGHIYEIKFGDEIELKGEVVYHGEKKLAILG